MYLTEYSDFDEDILLDRLSAIVKFPTVSDPLPENMDLEAFRQMQRCLEETYPLLHSTLTCTVIGHAGLLYRWKGRSSGSPILLAAHQDVVPSGDEAGWKYPPFAGTIEDGVLYSRGSSDCKARIIAHMEAVEALIRKGFEPECDVYLAYGYNEEVASRCNSAAAICAFLQEQGVELGCVVDEGGGAGPDPDEGISHDLAYVYTAEKGYADIEFVIRDAGGHSMNPGRRSIVAELGILAAKLHENQYPLRLTDALIHEYEAKAPYMDDPGMRAAFAGIADGIDPVLPFIENDPKRAAKFHTTMALTMLEASSRSNVLPTRVRLVMNCRLQEGDTVAALMEKCRKTAEAAGISAEINLLDGREHTAISKTEGFAYECLAKAICSISPDAVIIPAVVGGATDARHYYPICGSVYRFSGFPSDSGGGAHNFNEYFRKKGFGQGALFFSHLLEEYCSA